MPLPDLLTLPANPKTHDIPVITASVDLYGFLDPIVINTTTGHVLSGNGRRATLASKHAAGHPPPKNIQVDPNNQWLVPVHYVTVEPHQEMAAAIALNRAVELGGWDEPTLATVLSDYIDQLPPGTTTKQVADLVKRLAPPNLDALAHQYGDNGPRDFWPTITVTVPPDVKHRFDALMATIDAEDDAARFATIVTLAAAP